MPAGTLHITNGDSAGEAIRQATGEDVLCWRDVLHDGPVPDGGDAELRDTRAAFLASRGWVEEDVARTDLERRDALVRDAAGARPIILWFEPDLYDQLQLIQVLDMLARAADGRPGDVQLIAPPCYLGGLEAPAMSALLPTRSPVGEAHFRTASAAWDAFRSPNPLRWAALARSDAMALPYLASAVRRHLEEYPDRVTGLARSERQVMTALARGGASLADAFHATQEMEDWRYLGDASFLDIVRELAAEPHPLVAVSETAREALGGHRTFDRDAWRSRADLTESGIAVLGGRRDRIALRGIDRWLGGVHLREGSVWRWDGDALIGSGDPDLQ